MKFNSKYKIELACGDGVLEHARLDAERGMLVATDRHIMVAVPVEVEQGDTTGAISVDAIKAAVKTSKDEPRISAGRELIVHDGPVYRRPEQRAFPNYNAILNPDLYSNVALRINPKLLYDLARAVGSGDAVTLRLANDSQSAMVSGPDGAFGVIGLMRQE